MGRVLVGTTAYNPHVQQMVRALYERDALAEYVTGGVDCFSRGPGRVARALIRRWAPRLDRELGRRAVLMPCEVVRTRWHWEAPRVAASRLGARRIEDWCWEHGELALDRYCAHRVGSPEVGGFLGVEYGALASLRAARASGKPGFVAFLSPHRQARVSWVNAEYARDPSLRTREVATLEECSVSRDARRDEEAATADWVIAGSSFTARTLEQAGVPSEKLLVVLPGGPKPIDADALPSEPPKITRFVYVGTAAVHKGAHLLLKAWRHVAAPTSELHFYGQIKLPVALLEEARRAPGGDAIRLHGSVPASMLPDVYQTASVLVFPTLCDGFGMVVSEAFASGLPVITTSNAGAADLVSPGQNGFVIPPAQTDALIDAMRWCAGHREELLAMRRAALATAARRTWADFRQEFHRVVSEAVGGRVPAATPRVEATA